MLSFDLGQIDCALRLNICTTIIVKRSLNKDLEEVVRNEYKIIYNTDPETTTNILNSIESIIKKLQTSSIDELVFMNAVIDKYKENKEWFKEYGETEFLKLD